MVLSKYSSPDRDRISHSAETQAIILGHEDEMKWVITVVAHKVCGRSLEVPQECWGRASWRKTQNRHLLQRLLMFPLMPQAGEHYLNSTEAEFLLRECSSPKINWSPFKSLDSSSQISVRSRPKWGECQEIPHGINPALNSASYQRVHIPQKEEALYLSSCVYDTNLLLAEKLLRLTQWLSSKAENLAAYPLHP